MGCSTWLLLCPYYCCYYYFYSSSFLLTKVHLSAVLTSQVCTYHRGFDLRSGDLNRSKYLNILCHSLSPSLVFNLHSMGSLDIEVNNLFNVLVSCGCHKKSPQTWKLKSTEINFLTFLEARNLKSVFLDQSQGP